MAISNPLNVGEPRHDITGRGNYSLQPRASQTFQNGSFAVKRIGSKLIEAVSSSAPRTDLVLLGTVVAGQGGITSPSTVDSNSGAVDADGKVYVVTVKPISEVGTGWFATGTGANQITANDVDKPCFLYDENTLYLTDANGTLSFAGWVADVDTNTGKVALKSSEQMRVLYALNSAGEDAPGYTSDDSVLFAMTNLPAGTFSGGVWTATATGALNTTQDGLTVTHAVGDKVMFPPGTLTTLSVGAADSGPYECVTPGATGVKAVYKRTARFAHGAIITPGTKIRVTLGGATTFGGTTWRCDPTTAAKVVGTDDPVLFPERVIVQKTLSSGTATIATVPLRAAGKFAVHCDYNGGTPAGTTTSIQASTQTPGALGTASIVIQEQSVLGTLVNTGSATCAVTIIQ